MYCVMRNIWSKDIHYCTIELMIFSTLFIIGRLENIYVTCNMFK